MVKQKVTNPNREFELELCGETIVLDTKFSNIFRLESFLNINAYELPAKLEEGRLGIGDMAAMIWACYEDRDSKGFTFDNIGDKIMIDGVQKLAPKIEKIVTVMYRVKEMQDFQSNFKDQSEDGDNKGKKKKSQDSTG